MNRWFPAVAALALTAGIAVGQGAALGGPGLPGADKGDWRRREVVRTYRDNEGCKISVISYHHGDGDVETRQSRDCGRD
ncbi:hypothetical protein CCR94_20180 [Rhodoblastus sphagnicola]|uniref:Uncharacterized protein n=1 Tax=Rhodoblastus sphagnicola TaxID=333368 RepID=A0A2S6MYE3_9HYPH|nr:hypothetical protein [Rhodoblastus sphagnicola]MBB4199419.1 hypothetical protein [Rhodoblastus sphagnicola]PPQ27393.1 hypothetical protein CCR94_20180 [Rhodoblastus sphagnicola]